MSGRDKLVEAGWVELKVRFESVLSDYQLDMMRMAYMAGAVHTFALCVLTVPRAAIQEPAELRRIGDEQRLRLASITRELEAFQASLHDAADEPPDEHIH